MANKTTRLVSRHKRKGRIRKRISGTPERPRLSVFRSLNHIYAQVIDDEKGHTLVSASTLDKEFADSGLTKGNKEAAETVGKIIGKRALEKGIKKVVFDRNGFLYHGRVKALSDGAREAGLKF